MRRVHWMELFFDLVFVVFIGQLAHGLHGEPGWAEYGGFLFVLAIGWWAWVNVTVVINVLPNLPVRTLSTVMLLGMVAVGAMAVAAPEALGERAWLFAIGSAALRLVLLPLWLLRAKKYGQPYFPVFLYNGVTAGVWIASAFVPQPAQFAVWAAAILLEVLLTNRVRNGETSLGRDIDVSHAAERLGLFVIIVMGESVFTVIEIFSEHFTLASGIPALLGMLLIGMLAWTYFLHSASNLEEGLESVAGAMRTRAIRDSVMLLPYLLVAGVTIVAAALASAIEHPEHHLSLGSALGLFVGLASFYLTIGLVGLRLGRSTRQMMWWLIVGGLAPALGLAIVLLVQPAATVAVAIAGVIVLALTVYTERAARRHTLDESAGHSDDEAVGAH